MVIGPHALLGGGLLPLWLLGRLLTWQWMRAVLQTPCASTAQCRAARAEILSGLVGGRLPPPCKATLMPTLLAVCKAMSHLTGWLRMGASDAMSVA